MKEKNASIAGRKRVKRTRALQSAQNPEGQQREKGRKEGMTEGLDEEKISERSNKLTTYSPKQIHQLDFTFFAFSFSYNF